MRRIFLGLIVIAALFLVACGGGADAVPMATPAPQAVASGDLDELSRMREMQGLDDPALVRFINNLRPAVEHDSGAMFNYGTHAVGNEHFGSYDDDFAAALIYAAIDATPAPRMLIQRAWLEMTVEAEEFNDAMTRLRNAAATFGGYTESSNLGGSWSHLDEAGRWARNFHITMRIPVARFDDALRHVEVHGEVLSLNQTTDDVTGQFFDTQRRMEMMMVQEARILELVDEAANLQQLFTIEDRLNQIRTQIELYRGSMEALGDRAAFSTINVTLWEILPEIEEEKEEEEEEEEEAGYTFGERVSNTFNTSVNIVSSALQGFVVFMAGAIVPLLVLGAIAAPIVVVVRYVSKKARERAAANPPKPSVYHPHYTGYHPHYAPYPPQYTEETPQNGGEVPEAAVETVEDTPEADEDEEKGE